MLSKIQPKFFQLTQSSFLSRTYSIAWTLWKSSLKITIPKEPMDFSITLTAIRWIDSYGIINWHIYSNAMQLEYIWSKNGPVSVHRIFPCFDQPDIKAIVQLFVFVPQPFAVTSNGNSELNPSWPKSLPYRRYFKRLCTRHKSVQKIRLSWGFQCPTKNLGIQGDSTYSFASF